MTLEVPPSSLAPISPRQEALGMMAEKKRQKWMREKGNNHLEIFFLIISSSFSGNGSNET